MENLVKDICTSVQIRYDIPAVSVCFTRNNSEHECFGLANPSKCGETEVNEKTLFGLGSVSKSFTSLLLSLTLQENPKISWDTPLKSILEDFSMSDLYREENICLRDVLSHKVGVELGETDFGYFMGNIERGNILKKLVHLPFAADFRTKMMYNNFMYTLGGIIAEKLTGRQYETLIKESIFDLLGMEDSTFLDKVDEISNVARPHVGIDGCSTPIDLEVHRMSKSVAPAASICSSARDMLKFLQFLLNKGSVGGVQIVNPKLLEECWKPQFALPNGKVEWDGYVSKPTFPVTESRDTYGFGWYMGTYRGYRMVAHSGEQFGYDCLVTLYPEMNIGIYTNINGPGGEPAFISNQLLHYYISDLLLGLEPWLTKTNIVTFPEPWKSRDAYFIPKSKSLIDKTLSSTHPIETYIGKYSHGFLGEADIFTESGELRMNMGKIGKFALYANGSEDEFRMVGLECLSFLHQWDLYSPSDWMTVRFVVPNVGVPYQAQALFCSLFESGPKFQRCNL